MNKSSDENKKIRDLTDEKNLYVEQLLEYAKDLRKTVVNLNAVHQELQEAYFDTIQRLVVAAEYRDEDTGSHIVRMSRYSAFIAEKKGFPKIDVQNILFAATMHDVGKIGIPDNILLKKGKLTDEEFKIIKTHCTIGARILSNSKSKVLQLAESIALTHHEKWNGKGYPEGLTGQKIPIVGRVVCLADVFDALTSKRPYKKPISVVKACDIIRNDRGKNFDPEIVDIFFDNLNEIIKIKDEVNFEKSVK